MSEPERKWQQVSLPQSAIRMLIIGLHVLYWPLFSLIFPATDIASILLGVAIVVAAGWFAGPIFGGVSGIVIGLLTPLILAEYASNSYAPDQAPAVAFWVILLAGIGVGAGQLYQTLQQQSQQIEVLRRERASLSEQLLQSQRTEEELRALTEAAEAANRAKTAFLANVSHELRTPLTTILGYTELLQLRDPTVEQEHIREDVQRIQQAGNHLLSLVKGVLDLSAGEANRITLWLDSFHLPALLDNIVAIVTPLAEQQHNTLHLHRSDDLGKMYADPLRVRQILLHVLTNAAKFTEHGRIEVLVTRSESFSADDQEIITFEVRDSGVGIKPEQLTTIFQPFSQMQPTGWHRQAGSGIGLALCKQFSERMGGDMQIESAPGVGTTVTIRIPAIVTDSNLPTSVEADGASL